MGIAERKSRQKQSVREAILQAAWHVVETEGWQSLSIRKIADAIEYSIPVIYDHFKNKEGIQAEFTRQGFELLNQALRQVSEKNAGPAEKLEAMAYAYWDFAFSNRSFYHLMYGMGMPTCETVRQTEELNTYSELILQPLKALIAAGANSADPMLKMHTYWSMLHGLVSINMIHPEHAKDKLNLLILEDFISGFLLSMT